MKTENTLRTVRNSLLCFFTALGAGLLAACGGGGGGTSTFPAYLTDAPVDGAEYSGPVSSDVTKNGGMFTASEGVFEFSVGDTTLGSVRLNSDWENSHVTPADFIGVDSDPEVIAIARVLQGLDGDSNPRNGISISQTHRGLTVDLFANAVVTASLAEDAAFAFVATVANAPVTLNFPTGTAARDHLIATRRCLYSGGYEGSYRSTVISDNPEEGESYFVFEPFANRVKGVNFVRGEDDRRFESEPLTAVGVNNKVFTISSGNQFSFVTPSLVTGIWTSRNDENEVTDSGTFRLNLVAGDPTANRRVVGVETEESMPVGIYVLNYFAGGDNSGFRGQYYDVEAGQSSVLMLTIATDGGSWPATNDADATTLTLSGKLGDSDTNVTVEVTRSGSNAVDGTFTGTAGTNSGLTGTWCDLVVAVSGGAPARSLLAMSHSQIGGDDVSAHRLSRYLDSGFPANTAIDGVQILG